jgi:UDP-N-acetylglucosamine 3-dehydrogenase
MPTKKTAKLKVVVIGAGNMGRNHLRTYSHMDSVELLALADINPEAAQLAKEYNIQYYSDYKKMFDERRPDAVSVVVPTPLHHKIGIEAMQRGIHCLLEKPIASTPEEGDELIAAAKKHKVIFTVGHIEHYNPMIQKLKHLVDSKEIGDISSIVIKRVGGFPAVEPKTDVIIDLAVHDIGVLSHLLNSQPKKVTAHGSKTLHSNKVDSAEILLDYGVASGFIQANWITPVKIRTIAVTGSDGYVEGNYITQELTYYKHNMKKFRDDFKNFVEKFGEPEKHFIADTPQEPLANEINAFVEAIKTGDSSHLVDPVLARKALETALTALK